MCCAIGFALYRSGDAKKLETKKPRTKARLYEIFGNKKPAEAG